MGPFLPAQQTRFITTAVLYLIMRTMSRLFVKKLTVIDFSYLHRTRGLLGESWLVDVELEGGLDSQGMVLDFADVKKTIKRLIDDDFDHKLIIPEQYHGSQTRRQDDRLQNRFTTESGQHIEHTAPASAYCFLDSGDVTPDALAEAIKQRLQPLLPENVQNIRLSLYPEAIDGPFYHYSHGLRQHAGNCQRIAHGHRSRIEIFTNGKRSPLLEQHWAGVWKDIYIGCRSDISGRQTQNNEPYLHFSYSACQGNFDLILPEKNCYLIDTDSTVENLARHLLEESARLQPGQSIRVQAYEGVDKGAIEVS